MKAHLYAWLFGHENHANFMAIRIPYDFNKTNKNQEREKACYWTWKTADWT